IEWFHIVREEAIAAGIRRIEAIAGPAVRDWAVQEAKKQQDKFEVFERKKAGLTELARFDATADPSNLVQQIEHRAAQLDRIEAEIREWEKSQAKVAEAN